MATGYRSGQMTLAGGGAQIKAKRSSTTGRSSLNVRPSRAQSRVKQCRCSSRQEASMSAWMCTFVAS